ncbi:TetR family transcriptional regulator [Frankia sp. CcI49]|uniref:TetR/AcrR family transcriptional regulator n=1 Tax=unclassified Frankia TaxID=2632575 RepID=UPI0006CA33BE|nr:MULTISPECIES: TetR/AcrR family transcriptional regulator [unclassified Frankia]KPM52324.1 TetR family transcriptional regulator [Frankia sp. R43]ONH59970.1 TetR family transcriptional regulator [Frankia sp. CcI49]
MAEPRRRRAATAEKVTRLLDATEEIMLAEGYAAVSSRSVAARAEITAPLLHYYFPTIDDLFVAVLRRRAEETLARTAVALASPRPLAAWWELVSDPRGTGLTVEFVAAANHRPALRAEVGRVARELRRIQIDALTSILGEYGLDEQDFPASLVAAAVQGLAFAVVSDRAAGHDTEPEEATAAMTRLVARLEDRRAHRIPG